MRKHPAPGYPLLNNSALNQRIGNVTAMAPLQSPDTFADTREKYDAELLMPLTKCISDAQLGTGVELSDGTVWEVFMINPDRHSRPMLKMRGS